MRNDTVTCDGCGKDITYTTNCMDYRLNLRVVSIPSRGGFVTAMNIVPPLDHSCDFCGLLCLAAWLKKQHVPA